MVLECCYDGTAKGAMGFIIKGAKKLAAHLEVQLIDRQGLEKQVWIEEYCYPSQIRR